MNEYHDIEYYKSLSFNTPESKLICKIINLNYNSNPSRLFVLLYSLIYKGLVFDDAIMNILSSFSEPKTFTNLNNLDNKLTEQIISRYSIDFANQIHINYCKCISEMNNVPLLNDESYLSTSITDTTLNIIHKVDYNYSKFIQIFNKYFVTPFNMSKITSTGLINELIITIDNCESINKETNIKIINDFILNIKSINPNINIRIIIPDINTKVAIMRSLSLNHITSKWMIYTDDDDISISLEEFSSLCNTFIIPPKMIYNFSLITIHYYPSKSIQLDGVQTNAVCLMPRLINVEFLKEYDLGNSCRTTTFEDNDVRINEFMKTNYLNLNRSEDERGVIIMNDSDSVIYTLRTPAYIYKDPSRRGCHVNDILMLRLSTYIGLNTYFFGNEYNETNYNKLNIKNMLMTHFINIYHFCHKRVDLCNVPSIFIDEDEVKEYLECSTKFIRENVYNDVHHPDEVIRYTLIDNGVRCEMIDFAAYRRFRNVKIDGEMIMFNESKYTLSEWNKFVDNKPIKNVY